MITIRDRLRARRYQRWTEIEPEDDYARKARTGVIAVVTTSLLVAALVVVGFVIAR